VPPPGLDIPALIVALSDPSQEVRMAASDSLAAVGLSDARVVPALCQAGRAGRSTWEIAGCLDRIQVAFTAQDLPAARARIQVAFEAISGLLELNDVMVRRPATWLVVRIIASEQGDLEARRGNLVHWPQGSSEDERELSIAARALAGQDSVLRYGAALAMMSYSIELRSSPLFRATWQAVIPTLIAALDDPSREVRYWIVRTLANLGPEAHAAREALKKLARDEPDRDVRQAAADAARAVVVDDQPPGTARDPAL
jgi:HEAT repeat protein